MITPAPSARILPATWKLMRLRWRITLSNFKRATTRRKIAMVFVGLLILSGLAFVFGLSWAILSFLKSPMLEQNLGNFTGMLGSVPGLMMSAAFFGILVTSFGVLLQGLYLSGDMDFLLSSPLPIRSVFLAKLLQAVLPNLALITLFALPVLYGLGAANGYNLLYYPFAIIIITAMALAAAGISALLVMILVRIVPARRLAEVLGFVGAVLAMVMSQSGNIINFSNVSPSEEQLEQVFTTVQRFDSPWMPLTWAGRGLVALGEGEWLPALGLVTLTLGVTIAIFWVALVTAERWFYTGWAGMQIITTKKKSTPSKRIARPARFQGLTHWIPAGVRAILRKDLLVLRRDLRNLSQLVTPLIFGVIYSFMLLRNSNGASPIEQGQAPNLIVQASKVALVYSSVGISIFVGWMLLARLALMGFSMESHSYWVIKSAPVGERQLLAAKFLVAYLPTLVLGSTFLTVIIFLQKASLSIWLYGLFVIVFSNAGLASINLAFGVAGAKFDWKDPRKMASASAGCVSALVSMIYIAINLGLFFAPPVLFAAIGSPQTYGQFLGGMFGGIMSTICVLIPPWMVRKRIPYLAEDRN